MALEPMSIIIGVLACVVFVAALTNPLIPDDDESEAESSHSHWLQ